MPCGRPRGLSPIRAGPRWRMYDVCVGQRKRAKAGSVGFIWTWLEFLIGLLGGEGRQGCPSLSWQLLLLSNTSTPGFRSLMCLHSIIDLVCVLHSTCHDFIYHKTPNIINLLNKTGVTVHKRSKDVCRPLHRSNTHTKVSNIKGSPGWNRKGFHG